MKFIEFCVRHPVTVIVGVLLTILFGVIAILDIPRQLTPTVEVPVIGVTVTYLGAAPQEIEREIVNKIEKQLNAVEGMREMTSSSAENSASIRLEFDWGTSLDTASIDVINKLNIVRDLPKDSDAPIIFFGEQFGYPVCFISLKGEGETSDDLREFAEDALEPELKRISGVSRVEVYGGRERQVEAVFDPYQLAAYHLTPLQVSQILAAENENTRGGRIEEEKNRWVVRTVGEFRTAEDVENVLLRRAGMPDVRMGDLLEVSQQSFKDAEAYVRIDGGPGIVFAVFKKTGENVVEIVQHVYEKVNDLNKNVLARQHRQMSVVYNEAEYIDRSMQQLQGTVIFCAVLAGAVLILFLRNWQAILTIFITIPISFVATFIFLWILGRTLNVISLAGLAFAIGMLVDNSIVVLENIYRHRQMGKGAFQAALDGAGEVWGAVLASTLTTVAVFVPILLIKEEAGQLFRDIALAIAISVALSLVVSLTVIPMLTARILAVQKDKAAKEAGDAHFAFRRGVVWVFLGLMLLGTAVTALVCLALAALLVVGLLAQAGVMQPPASFVPWPQPKMLVQALTPDKIPGLLLVAIFLGLTLEFPRLCLRLDKRYKDVGEHLGLEALRRMDLVLWSGAMIKRGLTLLVHWLMGGMGRGIAVAGAILGVFAYLLVFFALSTPASYLPTGNRNFAFGFIDTEAGSGIDHNLQVAEEAERRIITLPGVERFFIVTLADRIFFGAKAKDADEARAVTARISAALGNTPPPFLPPFVIEEWFKKNGPFLKTPMAGVRANVQQVTLFQRRGFVGGQQISIAIRGDDLSRLYAIAGSVMERLQGRKGVNFVLPSFKLGNWELRPTVDRKRAADVGMTASDVGYTVGSIVSGFKVADFREESGNELDLTLRGDPRYRQHIEQLGDLPVWTPLGRPVPLGVLAPVKPASGFNVIEHTEQQRSVELTVVLQADAAMGEVQSDVRSAIIEPLKKDGTIPPNYIVDLRGTAKDLDLMLAALKTSLILALLITYLLMAALFESFAHPFVIMLSVPLAIVGGYLLLWGVTMYNLAQEIPPPQLDVVTMLGFVILVGIVVNNAILVVAQALNFMRNERLKLHEAIIASVESRIRPIFMSTLTSIFGMLPLVLRPGPGSELYQGLGAVVVGGLAVSTVFTLILTPVLFSFGYGITARLHAAAVRLGIVVASGDKEAMDGRPEA